MEILLAAIAEAILGIVIGDLAERHLVGRIREQLRGNSPEKLALENALINAYLSFSKKYPDLVASLFDELFLNNREVVKEFGKLLTPHQQPKAQKLIELWQRQVGTSVVISIEPIQFFIDTLDNEIKARGELRDISNSRNLEYIATRTDDQNELLQQIRDLEHEKSDLQRQILETLKGLTLQTSKNLSPDPFEDYLNALENTIKDLFEAKLIRRAEATHAEPIPLTMSETPESLEKSKDMLQLLYEVEGIIEIQKSPQIYSSFQEAFDWGDKRILLLGEPGAGKTMTLLQFAQFAIAKRRLDKTASVPILGLIASWDTKNQTSFISWLAQSAYHALPITEFEALFEAGKALLLLDGLDELASEQFVEQENLQKKKSDPRQRFIEAIPNNNQIIVTCRRADYEQIGTKISSRKLSSAITLHPLSSKQIQQYLSNQPELWRWITRDEELKNLVATPLLLSVFAFAYKNMTNMERNKLNRLSYEGDLRDKIFDRYVEELYKRESHKLPYNRIKYSIHQIKMWLSWIAFNNLSGYEYQPNIIKYDDIKAVVEDCDLFLEYAKKLQILFESQDHSYRFTHLMLETYLAYPLAIKLLNSSSETERHNAAYVLGETGDKRAIPALLNCLNDESENVRSNVVSALNIIGGFDLVKPLAQAYKRETDAYIRWNIVETLGSIGGDEAIAELYVFLRTEDDINVLDAIRFALQGLDALDDIDDLEQLIENLLDNNWEVHWYTVEKIRLLNDPDIVSFITESVYRGDWVARWRLIEALGDIAMDVAIPTLIDCLSDEFKLVREAAAEALEKIGTQEACKAVAEWRKQQNQ